MTPYVGAVFNTAGAVKWLEAAQAAFNTSIMRALERTAEQAATYAKTSTLYRSHTYGLRKSITWGAQLGSTSAHAVVRASAPYAGFVENGTKPHDITPRRAQVLRFQQNGAIRFARIVHHPGTAPRPFMAQAADKVTPLFERLVNEAITKALT